MIALVEQLPIEILLRILSESDARTLRSFRLVSRHITINILIEENLSWLQNIYHSKLLSSENAWRDECRIPFYPDLPRVWPRYRHGTATNGLLDINYYPCYTCQEWVEKKLFSAANISGPRALGQRLAHTRLCIPCGIAIRYYLPGCRPKTGMGICETCSTLVEVHTGQRGVIPWDEIRPKEQYWWDHSHRCVDCMSGCDFATHKAKVEADWTLRVRQRYAYSMLARQKARQEKGEQIRLEKGITGRTYNSAPVDLSESLSDMKERFPKYQPVLPMHGDKGIPVLADYGLASNPRGSFQPSRHRAGAVDRRHNGGGRRSLRGRPGRGRGG